MNKLEFDMQLFNDGDKVDTVAGLDALLSGNTTNQEPTEPQEPENDAADIDGDNPGGGQNLDPSEPEGDEPPQVDKPSDDGQASDAEQQRQNAAFARLRTEANQANKTLKELAKALGIDEVDPVKQREVLLELAYAKLAEKDNVPKELYKELITTKEQLALVQMEQNRATAVSKFRQLGEAYELKQDDLINFAKQLDQQGVNVVEDPSIDLEYYYYKFNRAAIEDKKIQRAVQEALKKDTMAGNKSTTPSKQSSKGTEEPAKVNTVSALDALLDGKDI